MTDKRNKRSANERGRGQGDDGKIPGRQRGELRDEPTRRRWPGADSGGEAQCDGPRSSGYRQEVGQWSVAEPGPSKAPRKEFQSVGGGRTKVMVVAVSTPSVESTGCYHE